VVTVETVIQVVVAAVDQYKAGVMVEEPEQAVEGQGEPVITNQTPFPMLFKTMPLGQQQVRTALYIKQVVKLDHHKVVVQL
jgi:hypothetical protein